MKKFLAIYVGTMSGPKMEAWNAMDPETRKEKEKAGMEAWFNFMQENEASIVEPGGPLGKTKAVSNQGIADTKNQMSGYTVVQAESHEAAAKLFENHPHFAQFPGEAIEIMEILPIPER